MNTSILISFHRCAVQSFHPYVQFPTLSSQVDVIHSLCASLNELDTSLDCYKYNHSLPTIKCTVLCFRLMFFLSIEKKKMVGQLFFFSVAFSLLFSFTFPQLYLFPLSLSLSLPLSLNQLQTFFAIFTRQLFIYVSKCTAGFYFIFFYFFTMHFIGKIQSRSTCNVAWIPYCDAQVTSGLGSITLSLSKLSFSLSHIYQSLI